MQVLKLSDPLFIFMIPRFLMIKVLADQILYSYSMANSMHFCHDADKCFPIRFKFIQWKWSLRHVIMISYKYKAFVNSTSVGYIQCIQSILGL